MAFDTYVVAAEAKELNNRLAGARIERVYQPGREELLLCANTPPKDGAPGARHYLFLSANGGAPAFYLAQRREASPQDPPAFCMLLRKHLAGARIRSVEALPRERIVRIECETSNELGLREPRTLVFELMGKHSNLILLKEGLIVDAIKRVPFAVSRVRQILPGLEYSLPPAGKGISPLMEAEAEWEEAHGCAADYEALAASGIYTPSIWYGEDGTAKDFHVFPLRVMEAFDARIFESVSEMLETWFENRENAARLSVKGLELSRALRARLDKLLLKKQKLGEDLLEAARAEDWKKYGDLVTANIWRLEKGADSAELENWEAPSCEGSGDAGEPALIRIPLDSRLTPAQNAQRYYKRYTKAKTAAVEKQRQKEETQRQIDYVESVLWSLESAQTPADVEDIRAELQDAGLLRIRGKNSEKRRKNGKSGGNLHKAYFAPIRYTLPSGMELLVGRNNRENDELSLRAAKANDLWLHTKDIPGSHAILRAPEGAPRQAEDASEIFSEADIRTAAGIAAWHSRARGSEGVPVDFTFARYVKKPSGAGPGTVIFTRNRTIYVTPGVSGDV